MRYSLRTLLEVVAAVAFILALVIAWRAKSGPPPAPPPAPSPGRYQVFMSGDDTMVIDTATGWLWAKPRGHTEFYRMESPWRERQ